MPLAEEPAYPSASKTTRRCSWELLDLCERVGSPQLAVTMDVANALAVGETPAAFAQRVMPFSHVHFKDYTIHPTPSGYRWRCALVLAWSTGRRWSPSLMPALRRAGLHRAGRLTGAPCAHPRKRLLVNLRPASAGRSAGCAAHAARGRRPAGRRLAHRTNARKAPTCAPTMSSISLRARFLYRGSPMSALFYRGLRCRCSRLPPVPLGPHPQTALDERIV